MFIPFFNLVWWAMGFVFLDRRNRDHSHQQLAEFGAQMQTQKCTVVMAPEGTRSLTGELGVFKYGAFHVALAAKAPIFPVIIYGNEAVWPRTHFMPKGGLIEIDILPEVPTTDWTLENLKERVAAIREIYLQHLEKKRLQGEPPSS